MSTVGLLKEAFHLAISFVKMKSDVPSLPNCYSLVYLESRPSLSPPTSKGDEEPWEAKRVQPAR